MKTTYSLNRLLVILASAGFCFLTIDNLIEHFPVLVKEPLSFIPVGFGIIALFFGIAASVSWKNAWIHRFQIILLAAFVISAAGLYFHIVESDDEEAVVSGQVTQEREVPRPPLAPLSFGAVASVGLLGTLRRWPAEIQAPVSSDQPS